MRSNVRYNCKINYNNISENSSHKYVCEKRRNTLLLKCNNIIVNNNSAF